MNRAIIVNYRNRQVVIPRQMRNRYAFNKDTLFEGTLYFINLDRWGQIRLDASLSKYQFGTRMKRKSFFNWAKVAKPYEWKLWMVNTGNPPWGSNKSELNNSGGEESWIKQPTLDSYRTLLTEYLLKEHKGLDSRIIQRVFAPLDQRIRNAMRPTKAIRFIEESLV